ncbi:hypothetical protein EPUS_07032 [Endocarpon pusillum Z07020]|uniref:Queuine tRNA-ribosyltransferase accessory subunit 2 n=1 Tax=Endocarpon pusillum (strain Z07020 / HMAS-L-300199) TaxID=1263415 RepID=U1GDI6_ENDPU|nr:uncharacterized protein EPUS_07032 [Endocarpon pusillum Z07020]ERF69776.1 hypothetical protein EPUS_07032 [Endocarpon pusillum Z07020]
MLSFFVAYAKSSTVGPRVGRLTRVGQKAIKTPHYVATTSRGVVPHISHDTLQKHTAVSSIYLALEDFIEKRITGAPIFKTPAKDGESPLRKYVAAQDDVLSILGPRRVPALPCPAHNNGSAISICTSVGFSQLNVNDYHDALRTLRPDIAITMADVVMHGTASVKRIEKSADRTHAWLRDACEQLSAHEKSSSKPAIFAAIPPIANVQQSLYLQDLAEEYRHMLSGLAIYSSTTAVDLPQALFDLPRMSLSEPGSPHSLLKDMALGVDLLCIPFIGFASDHGIALVFEFPGPDLAIDEPRPLGIDLWSIENEASLLPLSPHCECFTCTRHHKAYIHHLLQAKEMLAWTLLQIHNLSTMDRFFDACRKSIANGSFEEDVELFTRRYETDMPAKTGSGPRIRGYQIKSSGGGEARKNEKAWDRFDDMAQQIAEAESGLATAEGDSKQLEDQGIAERV